MEKKSALLEHGMFLSWGIALVATLGSLYLSEILGMVPCTYCWFQRILMYPLVIILGIAAVRKDYKQVLYTIPITVLGFCISTYHYINQKTSWFDSASSNTCGIVPCSKEYINVWGFITIPLLAWIAFVLIFIIQLLIWKKIK